MKSFTRKLGLATLAFAGAMTAHAASLDAKQSQIKWTGYGVGKSHWGYVDVKEANVKTDKKGEPIEGKIVVDLTTIVTKDIGPDKGSEKLDGHLKAADFFDVETFPTASFESKSIKKEKDGSYKVVGTLSVKDKKGSETVVLKPATKDGKQVLEGKLTFDRSKYNVKYNSQAFSVAALGDKLIKDNIDLELSLPIVK